MGGNKVRADDRKGRTEVGERLSSLERAVDRLKALVGLSAMIPVSFGGAGSTGAGAPWHASDPSNAASADIAVSPEAKAQVSALLKSTTIGPGQSRSVAVVASGHVILEDARGASPKTVYPIASLSKAVTAAAVLASIEEGAFELDTDIGTYFEELEDAGITIENLLAHTSGLPDYTQGPLGMGDGKPIESTALVERYFASHPAPRFAPGSRCEYSNTNYVLLGRILELASEKSYDAVVRERVLEPLDLDGPYYPGQDKGSVAPPSPGSPATHPTWAFAAGGLIGTAREVGLFNNALLRGELLSEESTGQLFEPHSPCPQGPYSFGYFLAQTNFPSAHHSGSIPGYSAEVVTKLYPDDSITVVLLTSVSQGVGLEQFVSSVLASISPDVRMSRWIERVADNDIDYDQLDPGLGALVMSQIDGIAPQIAALGELQSLKLQDANRSYDAGQFQYRATHAGGSATWTLEIAPSGVITGLAVQP